MNHANDWHKSTFSAEGNCVEVKVQADVVLVRHTRDQSGPQLRFTHSEWSAFLLGVADGQFNLP